MNCCDDYGVCQGGPGCPAGKPIRKIKPYPAVPPDIEPVSEGWQTVGSVMLICIFGVLALICLALFFTGVWVWSLLL